ncbi:MAG: hypothetical protein ACRD3W_17130, partial [Terriglobales bacterium]
VSLSIRVARETPGQHEDCCNRGLIPALSASEHTEDEVVDLGAGPEQEASLDGAAGDGNEGPGLGNETKFSGHIHLKTEKLALILQGVCKPLSCNELGLSLKWHVAQLRARASKRLALFWLFSGNTWLLSGSFLPGA